MRGGLKAVLLVAAGCTNAWQSWAASVNSAETIHPSQSVTTALASLGAGSLRFFYSTQLVPDSLQVLQAPAPGSPIAMAREILAPHGLTLIAVANDVYAVAIAAPATLTPGKVAAAAPAPGSTAPADLPESSDTEPRFETIVQGERYPFGLKRADDSLLFSATRLGAQPSLGEDSLYSLARMPGITQGDLSGRLNIRGGGPDETLILMDGFPLRQAYHMPGYRGVLTVIDPGLLSEIGLYAGAIPARYGDRMSGVLELRSLTANDEPRTSLGLGFLNARARTDLALGNGDDDLVLAMRVGATGYLVKAIEPAAGNPRYGDAYARLRVAAGKATTLTFNALLSRDDLTLRRNGFQETSSMQTHLAYLWMQSSSTLQLGNGDDALLEVWLGNSDIDTQRSGVLDSQGYASGALAEDRKTSIWDLRTRLQWQVGDQHVLETGAQLSFGDASYDYASEVRYLPAIANSLGVADFNSQQFRLQPNRRTAAVFLADSWAIAPRLTAQLGLRVLFADSSTSSTLLRADPRLALSWQASSRTTVHASWGQVHQVGDLSEIVPGRDPQGRLVGQQTEYSVLGFDQALTDSLLLRVEAFHKEQLHLLPLQRNLLRSPSILPELSADRMWFAPQSATINGAEAYLQQSVGRWHWSASYAWSMARDFYPTTVTPRSGDQRNAASFTLDWTNSQWLLSSALNYRGGLPTTTFGSNAEGGIVFGQRQLTRLPGSLGADVRLKWRHALAVGSIAVTGQLSNLFSNSRSCCAELALLPSSALSQSPQLYLRSNHSLPVIPWAGVSWDF